MSKTKKKSLVITGCVVGGIGVLALTGSVLLHRSESLVRRALSSVNASFNGQLDFKSLRFDGTAVSLYGVTLKDDRGELLVEVPKLEAGLNLGNFLSYGNLLSLPGTITIYDPRIYATIDKYGRLNFASLASPSDKPFTMPQSRYLGADLHLQNGTLIFKDQRAEGFMYELKQMQLDLLTHPFEAAQLDFSALPGQNQPGVLQLHASIYPETPDFSGNLQFSNLQLPYLASYPAVHKYISCNAGRGDGHLWVKCDGSEWQNLGQEWPQALSYGGELRLQDGALVEPNYGVAVRQIQTTAQVSTGLVRVKKAFANIEGMGATLDGLVYITPQMRFDLHARMPRVRPQPIEKILHKTLPISGSADVEVCLEGTPQRPELSGTVQIAKLSAQGQDLRNCRISWNFADNLFNLDSVRGSAVGGEFSGRGLAYFGAKNPYVVFNLQGKNANLSGLSPVGGRVDSFKVSLLGDVSDPLVYGNSRASGFSGLGTYVDDVSGHFLYSGHDVLLSQGSAQTGLGQVDLPYAFYDLKQNQILAALDTSGITVPTVNIRGFGAVSGRLGGTFQLSGSLNDLSSLDLVGYSRNTQLSVNALHLSDFNGAVGMDNLNLFTPCLSGQGAGGKLSVSGWVGLRPQGSLLAYSGNASMAMLGEKVRLDGLMQSLPKVSVPLDLSQPTDLGACWYANSANNGNWANLYATASEIAESAKKSNSATELAYQRDERDTNASGEESAQSADSENNGTIAAQAEQVVETGSAERFALAGHAFYVNNRLGALAWSQAVPVNPLALSKDFVYKGSVTGQLGASGSVDDLTLAYCANLNELPLSGLKEARALGRGFGRYHRGEVELKDNFFYWQYDRQRWEKRRNYPRWSGRVNSWFGPTLERRKAFDRGKRDLLPQAGMALINAKATLGKQPAYDVDFGVLGVELGWLTDQDSVPQLRKIADDVNLCVGILGLNGGLSGQGSQFRIKPGTTFDLPVLLTERDGDYDVFSGAGSVWSEPSAQSALGMIHLDPVVLSNRPFDPMLPFGDSVRNFDWQDNFRRGWLYAKGWVDMPEASLAVAMDGWSLDSLLSFAPESLPIPDNMCQGLWRTNDLLIDLDTRNLRSLGVQGTIAMQNGAITYNGSSIPIRNFVATIDNQDTLRLKELFVDTGLLQLHGEGERDASGRWIAKAWTDSLPLDYLSSFDSRFERLRGTGALAMQVTVPEENLSEPDVCVSFEGQNIELRPKYNSTTLFSTVASQHELKMQEVKSESLGDKLFAKKDDQEGSQSQATPEEVALLEEDIKRQRIEEFISKLSKPVKFSRFQIGKLGRDDNGNLFTNDELGISLHRAKNTVSVDIPTDAVRLEAYDVDLKQLRPSASSEQQPEPELPSDDKIAKLSASGHMQFGTDFSQGMQNWFLGECGPDFGTAEAPFTLRLDNMSDKLCSSLRGYVSNDSYFSVSGDLALRGQWYRDSDLLNPNDTLRYLLDIDKLEFGHYNADNSDWVGLTLEDKLQVNYGVEDQVGRLRVPEFKMIPHDLSSSFSSVSSNAQSTLLSGAMGGEANLVLAKADPSMDLEKDSFARLRISNMPVSGLASYVTKNANLGYINAIDLEAYGSVTAPDLKMSFDVTDGELGKLSFKALDGYVIGNPKDNGYVVDIGDNFDNALRLYLGSKKQTDWSANLWGKIPFEIERSEVKYDHHLLPVWSGVTYSQNEELDVVANLTDKNFRTIGEFVPGITKSQGDLSVNWHLTGTYAQPEVTGNVSLQNGAIEHEQLGPVKDISIDAVFEEVPAEQLRDELRQRFEQFNASRGRKIAPKIKDGEMPPLPSISRLSLNKFSSKFGEQILQASGKADLLGYTPLEVDISLNGNDLPLHWGDMFDGTVDVNMDVQANRQRNAYNDGDRMMVVVGGKIDVKAAEINVPVSSVSNLTSKSASPLSDLPLYYQLQLNMSDNVWINALNSRIRTVGNLYIMPDEQTLSPILAGSLDVSRGTLVLPLYDVRFKMRQGQLTFESQNNPVFEDISADADVGGYQISAFVDGTYPDINLRFSSYPYLSEDDIKRLLALGTVSTGGSSMQQQQYGAPPTVGQQAISASSNVLGNRSGTAMLSRMLASPITESISRMLFLTDFSMDIDSSNNYSFKIAKAIDSEERFLFTLTTSYNSHYNRQENLYGLEWRIRHNILARIACDQYGRILPWFQGRWEY